jgi:5'-3' exonuclease
LKILSEDEITYYNDLYNNRRHIRRTTSTDPFDIDKHNFEENIINNFKDEVQLGNPKSKLIDWKYNYYKHYYHIEIDRSNPNDNSLNSIIDDYIRGLVWTNYYYFDKCKDYEWFFEHHHGMFISDIYSYLLQFPNRLTIYEELYSHGVWYQNKIKPLHQLMLVLPHESSYLIPSSYRTLMFGYKLKKYFPNSIIDIKMDYLYKNKAWQNIPMINIIPPNKILQLTSKIIINEENERNKLYNDYVKLI